MPLICLSGWKRSGKDALCTYLVNNYNASQLSFAGPLKDMASQEYGVPRNYFDDQDLKEAPLLYFPITPKDEFAFTLARFMYKEFRTLDGGLIDGFMKQDDEYRAFKRIDDGMGYFVSAYHTPRSLAILKGSTNRTVDPNFWIKKAFQKADSVFQEDPNKLLIVTDLRYKSEAAQTLVRFPNALIIRIDRFPTSPSNDPSERDMDNFSFKYRLDNTGTLENTYLQLDSILKENGVI